MGKSIWLRDFALRHAHLSDVRKTRRFLLVSIGTSSWDRRRCVLITNCDFAYNWHWFWETGNGDIGNQGIHQMDVARWGLGVELPTSVSLHRPGKYVFNDEPGNAEYLQIATFDYGDKELMFEVRGLPTGSEGNLGVKGKNSDLQSLLWSRRLDAAMDDDGFQVYKGYENQEGPWMKRIRIS